MSLYRFEPFVEKFKGQGVSPGGLRHQIAHADVNGLARAGAISRFWPKGPGIGKPIILIDADKYFAVLGGQQSKVAA